MKCRNCGYENAADAKFCGECGMPLNVDTQQAAGAPRAEETPKMRPAGTPRKSVGAGAAPKVDMQQLAGKAKAVPKTALIGAGVGVAALLLIGGIVVHNGKTINLNKYITIESSGYNGYGSVYATIDWDAIEKKYGSKISFTSDAKKEYGEFLSWTTPIEVLQSDVDVEFEQDTRHLSNGDKLEYTIDVDDEIAKYLKCKLKYKAGSYTVSDLEEVDTFDAFADLDVEFSGISPDGKANLNYTGTKMHSYDFSCDKTSGLSNGDVVTVTIDEDTAASYVQSIGQIPAEFEKTYTVEGLESYLMHTSEIDEAALQSMQTQANDAYNAYVAKNWGEGESLESLDYIGMYLLTRKDTSTYSYSTINTLYLVYKVKVHNTYSSDYGSYDQANTFYWYISFDNLMVGQDGSVSVNLSDYNTAWNTWNTVTMDSGVNEYSWGYSHRWNYTGYATLDDLYKDAVTQNIDAFNHEDNVTDNA